MDQEIMTKEKSVSFNPKQATKKLLAVLSSRAKDVITGRYGLGTDTKRLTLEEIGKKYSITRERVRQIENHSLANIRKSKDYEKLAPVFEELFAFVHSLGGIISEDLLLNQLTKDKGSKNFFHFLLVVGEKFKKQKEDGEFAHRWHLDDHIAKAVEEAIRKVYSTLPDDAIVPEAEMISSFLEHIKELSDHYKNEEMIRRWLQMSKKLAKNPLGEWGKANSSNIKARGVRDYAFLVIRKHGSPIHFREVAKSITEIFKKKAHIATTHNELIKDPRFVLVGRGLYALSEWGYAPGVVKDVIRKVLEKNGPLPKEKIIEQVLKDRYVKENTIMVNLQNSKYFKKREKDGCYFLVNGTK